MNPSGNDKKDEPSPEPTPEQNPKSDNPDDDDYKVKYDYNKTKTGIIGPLMGLFILFLVFILILLSCLYFKFNGVNFWQALLSSPYLIGQFVLKLVSR